MRKMYTRGDRIFEVCNNAFMLLILFITLYPFWDQVVVSLSGGFSAYEGGFRLWPSVLSFETYELAFRYHLLWIGFRNSVIRVVLGTIFSVSLTAMVAYPLSKRDLPFNGLVTSLLFFTMLFSGGLIPSYLLIRNLGLMDTLWALILPGMVSAWNTFIMRNFFRSISPSLEESAKVDGAGYMRIFLQIVLPLSTPVLATVALWCAVGHWNAWFDAMIYVRDTDRFVLQAVLRKLIIDNDTADLDQIIRRTMNRDTTEFTGRQLEAAVVVVSMIPMMIIYPFAQKYFVKGVMVGSIKG